ncbi:MAG: tryptophan synthase subunit alpha [Leptospiraceae bacterium]|nr:tryptophan synthase subunit alpha [Leptospiraceae bacterium]MCP5497818.1 tryptophan synthase subunit alpha [Leptospiraceae bacterium]
MIEKYIKEKRNSKDILLMTHLVIGHPSLEENYKVIDAMVEYEVDLIELQIPFSEPTADGPVILKANHNALKQNIKIQDCFKLIQKVSSQYPQIPFLIMTYYNILFCNGEKQFVKEAKNNGIKGFIIPDLPPEEAGNYLEICRTENLDTIFIFTPTNSPDRLKEISESSTGFIYCIGRKGVTGTKTTFNQETLELVKRYKKATNLPLAMGFGIQERSDIELLKGQVDIAVIGSKLIQIQEKEGLNGIKSFLKEVSFVI